MFLQMHQVEGLPPTRSVVFLAEEMPHKANAAQSNYTQRRCLQTPSKALTSQQDSFHQGAGESSWQPLGPGVVSCGHKKLWSLQPLWDDGHG